MSTHRKANFINRVGEFIDLFGSAAATAAAVRSGYMPEARHLRNLGVDVEQFRAIQKR